MGRGEDAEKEKEGSGSSNDAGKLPFLGMFRYADRVDKALMAVGTVAAMANGMSEPLRTVVFSAVIDCFGGADASTVLHRVSKAIKYASFGSPYLTPMQLHFRMFGHDLDIWWSQSVALDFVIGPWLRALLNWK